MKIDGQEYHNLILDLLRDSKTKGYKTSASFLINKLLDKYDGLSNYISNIALQTIDYCMNGSNSETLVNYPALCENNTLNVILQNSNFTAESQIDISLLLILLLDKNFLKTENNSITLKTILETHSNKFFSINSLFIKDKLCLIFGQFLNLIFNEEDTEQNYEFFSSVFEFLFNQIFSYKETPGVAFQAAYAFTELIVVKEYSTISANTVKKIFPKLIENIREYEVTLIFDVIIDAINYLDIEENLLDLCKETINRILLEIKSSKKLTKKIETEGESEFNPYINKCFNILKIVLEKNKIYFKSNNEIELIISSESALELTQLENVLEPLVSYIKNPLRIEFDDEIIILLVSLMKNTKIISNLSRLVFPYLQACLDKEEGLSDELLELLNLYILYDTEGFLLTDNNAKILLNLTVSSIKDYPETPLSAPYGSLIMQVWLQTNPKIPNDVLQIMIETNLICVKDLYDIYKEDFNHLNDNSDVYKFCTCLSTLYSGLLNYTIPVLEILNSNAVFNDFLEWTELFLRFDFFSTYQSKIIILGICSILFNEMVINTLADAIPKFLFLIFNYLNKQKDEESKQLKKALKKELDCNFVESDNEDNNEEEDDEELHM